ncbi:UNVERIFIED_CONTAM: hypothetical protein GTU68_059819 [Idotea baltica]|nr:hypothetical protein [Idotea baltica]
MRNFKESATSLILANPNIPDEATQALNSIDSPSVLTDFLATNLSIDLPQKQGLLEETKVGKRLKRVQKIINNQLHIAELQQKLRAEVEDEFSDAQRRAYLREQLRAIQKELGEGEGTEEQVEELRERLESAGLSEEAMEMATRELKRLDVIPPSSPEHAVITTFLETLADLPWDNLSEDHHDLEEAQKILDRDHYGLEKVKKRLVEYLAVRKLNPEGRGPILCLLGPPGVGKTSLGHSIAAALGREFARISLGGIRDESEIRGHRRTYIGAMPGRLIQELRRVKTRNPILMLDEIDKIGADFRGDPASALLEVLDPAQNNTFVDRYVDVPFDLSQVIFISTANALDPIPGPLRDRMEVITLPGYTTEEKIQIAKRYQVKRQLKENGIKANQCVWNITSIRKVIEEYTREAGVRSLEREIGSVCRAVAARVAVDPTTKIKVTPVPAGATPKDGPSAGIAMFTALASLFANRRVNKAIAMTGEVTLRGKVLPIGGLKEKSLGAVQMGIKKILIPIGNAKDIPEIPDSARKKLKIVPVSTVEEVLAEVLLKK